MRRPNPWGFPGAVFVATERRPDKDGLMSFEEFPIDERVSPSSPSEMRRQGIRPFVVGAIGGLVITVVTLGLVSAADAVFQI
jgi:hypothetical protein